MGHAGTYYAPVLGAVISISDGNLVGLTDLVLHLYGKRVHQGLSSPLGLAEKANGRYDTQC